MNWSGATEMSALVFAVPGDLDSLSVSVDQCGASGTPAAGFSPGVSCSSSVRCNKFVVVLLLPCWISRRLGVGSPGESMSQIVLVFS